MKKKRATNGKVRTVMFCKEDEPGTAVPDYEALSPSSPTPLSLNNLSPKKELEKRYKSN